MKLIGLNKQIILFYKLANTPVLSEIGYQNALKRVQANHSVEQIYDAIQLIGKYYREPYFRIEDFFPFFEKNIPSTIDNKLFVLCRYVEEMSRAKLPNTLIEQIMKPLCQDI